MKKLKISFLIGTIIGFCFSANAQTRMEWEYYFLNRNDKLDPIEGLWTLNSDCIIAIYKTGSNTFNAMEVSDSKWRIGTTLSFEKKTSNSYWAVYDGKYYTIGISNGMFNFFVAYYYGKKSYYTVENKFSRLPFLSKPAKQEKKEPEARRQTSGSGFCISTNGIIVTNYHVIEDAKKITVRGVNSNFDRKLNAKVLVSDKTNDLALIQIDDYSFTQTAQVPYPIKTKLADVGESVFVLGYPLRATMGDEIKLTTGIVSARTGYQGDVTCYQISAPVQPGNSGGPLFDKQGNLIGIISSKHAEAESVSYAIKTSYLFNLIELLATPPVLQKGNLLADKSLATQVEMIKKFVYIIEAD